MGTHRISAICVPVSGHTLRVRCSIPNKVRSILPATDACVALVCLASMPFVLSVSLCVGGPQVPRSHLSIPTLHFNLPFAQFHPFVQQFWACVCVCVILCFASFCDAECIGRTKPKNDPQIDCEQMENLNWKWNGLGPNQNLLAPHQRRQQQQNGTRWALSVLRTKGVALMNIRDGHKRARSTKWPLAAIRLESECGTRSEQVGAGGICALLALNRFLSFVWHPRFFPVRLIWMLLRG